MADFLRIPGIQIASVIVAWLVFTVFSPRDAVVFVWSCALSHYCLGFYYSRKQLYHLATNKKLFKYVAPLCIAGALVYSSGLSAGYYFCLHHALNEAYLVHRFASPSISKKTRSLIRFNAFLLHATGYLILIFTTVLRNNIYVLSLALLIFSTLFAFHLILVYGTRRHFQNGRLVEGLFTELLLAILVSVDLSIYNVGLFQVVFYHFAFWVFYPAMTLSIPYMGKSFFLYAVATVLSIGLFWAFSPSVTGLWAETYPLYKQLFIIGAYVHITLSLAISNANPQWLVDIFSKKSTIIA